MKEITLEDLQEIGGLWEKGFKGRPLTEQEKADFGVIPKGAVMYPDYESYEKAAYDKTSTVHRKTGCDKQKGIYWVLKL